jgi:DnaK suppressor protein
MLSRDRLLMFKSLFENQRRQILAAHGLANAEFMIQPDDLLDEADLTSVELNNAMTMRLRNRETLFLKKLDLALERINAGTFGVCEACSESIEDRRLEARPTATRCIACKEADERRELVYGTVAHSRRA